MIRIWSRIIRSGFLIAFMLTTSANAANLTNLAVGKSAYQSSTLTENHSASRAVDGETSGTYTHAPWIAATDEQMQPWWEIDLKDYYTIEGIKLGNIINCCSTTLENFSIFVSSNSMRGRSLDSLVADPDVWRASHFDSINDSIELPLGAIGRFVRIQRHSMSSLQLVEVVIYGSQMNLARGKPVSMSSSYARSNAQSTVDGKRNGNYKAGFVALSGRQYQPWLQVDLQSYNAIDHVVLWNRTDCCTERLSNFTVFVSRWPFGDRSFQELQADKSIWSQGYGAVTDRRIEIPVEYSGRYIRIQLNGRGFLQLAELEVYADASGVSVGSQTVSSASLGSSQSARKILENHHSVEKITSSDNTWRLRDLIKVKPLDRSTIDVVNNAPVEVSDVVLVANVDGRSIQLMTIDNVMPHSRVSVQYPFLQGYRYFANALNNVQVDMQKYINEGGIDPDRVSIKWYPTKKARLAKRLAEISNVGWELRYADFNPNNDPDSSWMLDPNSVSFRRFSGAIINFASVINSREFKLAYRKSPHTDNAQEYLSAQAKELAYFNMMRARRLNLGMVAKVSGLGGSSTLGVASYVISNPTNPRFNYNEIAHIFGHVLGYAHSSSFTYGKRNDQGSFGFVRSINITASELFSQGKLPITINTYYPSTDLESYVAGNGPARELAQGQKATQFIDANSGATARAAVDGDTNGNYRLGSVSATASRPQSWWQVDLGVNRQITSISLYNRTECCSHRLENYYVIISPVDPIGRSMSSLLSDTRNRVYYWAEPVGQQRQFKLPQIAHGQFVRIQKAGGGMLSLAEVEVFGY